jgi:hypothetical protein
MCNLPWRIGGYELTLHTTQKPRKQKMRLTGKKCAGIICGMNTPREIINGLGRDQIVAALGVAPRRVDRARSQDALPASWYDGLCQLAGRDLPRHVFSFKYAERTNAAN